MDTMVILHQTLDRVFRSALASMTCRSSSLLLFIRNLSQSNDFYSSSALYHPTRNRLRYTQMNPNVSYMPLIYMPAQNFFITIVYSNSNQITSFKSTHTKSIAYEPTTTNQPTTTRTKLTRSHHKVLLIRFAFSCASHPSPQNFLRIDKFKMLFVDQPPYPSTDKLNS